MPELDQSAAKHDAPSPAGFIVGMSRAGTTWLGKCLNAHPAVAVFGETSFYGRWFVRPGDDGMYTAEQVREIVERLKRRGTCVQAFAGDGPGCLKTLDRESVGAFLDEAFADFESPCTPQALFQHLGHSIARSEGKSRFVEKTPHHVNWLDRIVRYESQARFIMLMREPYGFMRSYHHQGDRKAPEERAKYRWKEHPLGTALVWRGYVRSINEARSRHAECTKLVRFEEMTGESPRVLADVQAFLGLKVIDDLHTRVPADNTSFPDRTPPPLRGDEVFWMNLVAGRAMRGAGYERQSIPFQPLRIGVSVLLIPFWVVRQWVHFRRRTGGSLFGYVWNWLRPRGR